MSLAFFLVIGPGCSKDDAKSPAGKKTAGDSHPAELVGAWSAAGSVGGKKPGDRGMSWTKTYTFNKDGTFVMTGYPQIHVTGQWSVSKRDKNRFHLGLSKQLMRMSKRDKPSKWNDQKVWVELNGTKLTWGKDTFSRQATKPPPAP